MNTPSLQSNSKGVALIIVLGFIVIVTGVVVAFFSRTALQRQVSSSSANQTKVDLLATGAMEIIIGDLRDEIVQGSEAISVNANTSPYTVYIPRRGYPQTAIPAPVPADLDRTVVPNVLKVSKGGNTADIDDNRFFPSNAAYGGASVVPRASNAPTDAPSLNRRAISRRRWNAPLLLPTTTSSGTSTGLPVAQFPTPDWIYMTRYDAGRIETTTTAEGGESTTSTSVIDVDDLPKLRDPSSSNNNYAIGRFAYVIYDQGGLLDINLVGHPSTSTPDQTGRKRNAAYADLYNLLTQNPVHPMTDGDPTREFIDKFLSTRNSISVDFDGNEADADTARTFDEFLTHSLNGFVTGQRDEGGSQGESDQPFFSRQALIDIWTQGHSASPDLLQYFTTFSRDLDSPSFIPDSRLPAPSGLTAINPALPSFKLNLALTRTPGEPIFPPGGPFLRRFPLSWISDFDRLAGNTVKSDTNGVPPTNGDPTDNIAQRFGLHRTSVNDPWVYNPEHYRDNSATPPTTIETIANLANRPADTLREANFFEVLKAAVTAGSLAKTAVASSSVAYTEYQRHLDQNLDLAILQLGANIIDQYDKDSYPTRIEFTIPANGSSSARTVTISGVEDLPYLNKLRTIAVRRTLPVPPGTPGTSPANSAPDPVTNTDPNALSTPGKAVFLLQPEVWNPHAAAAGHTRTNGPTNFRFVVEATDPDSARASSPALFDINVVAKTKNYTSGPVTGTHDAPSITTVQLSSTASPSYITFTDDGSATLRDSPQWLAEAGFSDAAMNAIPGIATATGPAVPSEAPNQDPQVGIYLGSSDLRWIYTDPSTSTEYVLSANEVEATAAYPTGATNTNGAVVARLQYQSGADWITYDEKFVGGLLGTQDLQWGTTPAQYDYGFSSDIQRWAVAFDPRTSRFGMIHSDPAGTARLSGSTNPVLDSAENLPTEDFTASTGINITALASNNSGTPDTLYYEDRDGVVRRSLGGLNTSARPTVTGDPDARPVVLNREFETTGELGYAFAGTPWKNIDFTMPESGFAALLDVFTVNENRNRDYLVAGKINVNTANPYPIAAVLSGAIQDELSLTSTLSYSLAEAIAQKLVDYNLSTTAGEGPAANLAELVGRITTAGTPPVFGGFSTRLADSGLLSGNAATHPRLREATIRALSGSGTARVWNLLIDVIAQTGRFSPAATTLDQFSVEGERRLWIHVAIDRTTGKVIDRQIEVVTE